MAIESQIKDGIGVISLNRPEKANAYDRMHLEQLQAAFRDLRSRVTTVVLHSPHPRFFCAGADLDEMRDATPEEAKNLFSQSVFTEIARSATITIAVVDGPAIAGGFELALAADLRVIGPNASFRLPEVSLGIIPAAGGTTRLSALLGASIAKQVILGGQAITAEQAIDWGIGIRSESDPFSTAMEWAVAIKNNPEAASAAKRIVNTAAEDASLRDEREAQSVLYARRSD
jgi:enoyl-CoA hydratase/carnithine racemase